MSEESWLLLKQAFNLQDFSPLALQDNNGSLGRYYSFDCGNPKELRQMRTRFFILHQEFPVITDASSGIGMVVKIPRCKNVCHDGLSLAITPLPR